MIIYDQYHILLYLQGSSISSLFNNKISFYLVLLLGIDLTTTISLQFIYEENLSFMYHEIMKSSKYSVKTKTSNMIPIIYVCLSRSSFMSLLKDYINIDLL